MGWAGSVRPVRIFYDTARISNMIPARMWKKQLLVGWTNVATLNLGTTLYWSRKLPRICHSISPRHQFPASSSTVVASILHPPLAADVKATPRWYPAVPYRVSALPRHACPGPC